LWEIVGEDTDDDDDDDDGDDDDDDDGDVHPNTTEGREEQDKAMAKTGRKNNRLMLNSSSQITFTDGRLIAACCLFHCTQQSPISNPIRR